jgi:hypothetical protein
VLPDLDAVDGALEQIGGASMNADLFADLQQRAAEVGCRFVQRPRQLLVQTHIGPAVNGAWITFASTIIRPGADQSAVYCVALLFVSVLRGDLSIVDIERGRALVA